MPSVPPPPIAVAVAPGRYRPVQSLAIALKWLLVIEIAVTVTVALAAWHRRGLLDRVQRGDVPGRDELLSADDYVAATSGLYFLIAVAILVVLIVFLWRAAKNTELWQRERPRRGAGWAIGSWFIPLVNLVLPAMVVQDIWKRSPEVDVHGYRHHEPAAIVAWWWIAWIASGFLTNASASWGGDSATAAELSTGDAIQVVGAAFSALAALLLIAVVRRLAARQAVLARTPPGSPAPAPGPIATPGGQGPFPV